MSGVGFESKIPMIERAKTVNALNLAATMIGAFINYSVKIFFLAYFEMSQNCFKYTTKFALTFNRTLYVFFSVSQNYKHFYSRKHRSY
jgi:hypothetical protein